MKKRNKRPNMTGKKKSAATKPKPEEKPDRRALLQWWALGAIAVGGGGFFAVNSVMASLAEQDLSKIGQGIPAIVQIHDPGCAMCQQLQRETRAALAGFSEDELTYLVANIKSDAGAAFANAHGVSHITLMLFDGEGKRQGTLQGVRQEQELSTVFARLAEEG